MLENQKPNPAPLIGVGDELFQSQQNITGLNWNVVNLFRRRLMPLSPFRFVYLSMPEGKELHQILVELGLRFSLVQTVLIGNAPSERAMREMFQVLEFVYAPRLYGRLNVPLHLKVTARPDMFAEALASFTEGEPYSRDLLNKRYLDV